MSLTITLISHFLDAVKKIYLCRESVLSVMILWQLISLKLQ